MLPTRFYRSTVQCCCVIFFAISVFLSLSFGNKENTPFNTNWLVVEVDTAATGYFKVNPANRVLFSIEKRLMGYNFYFIDGGAKCCTAETIEDRRWADCWIRKYCLIDQLGESNYSIEMYRSNGLDPVYSHSGVIDSVEYRDYLFTFLIETKGQIIMRNDTLIFDMKNQMMGKEITFKMKCVRDSLQ